MTPSVRRVALAALALAAAPLTACTGGPGIHPGDAAVVGDQSISIERIDALAADICTLQEPGLAQQGAVLPMALLRSVAVETLVTDALLPAFAEEAGIDLAEVRRGVSEELETTLEELPAEIRDQAGQQIELEGTRRAVLGIAGREGAKSAEQATAQGAELFDSWRAGQDVEIDPRFGEVDLDRSAWDGANGSLSVPADDAAGALDQEAAAKLPASQRCGAPAAP